MPAPQFACWKGPGCTDALQVCKPYLISFRSKSLDAGKESYTVQLGFGAAFDKMSHSGLLFKLKSIGVGGSNVHLYRVNLRP